MATLGNLENKPVLVSEMREYVGNISAHARGGNTLKATKTGAMVSVDDAYAGALLKLTVYGNSVQDGTPTPESPVPIKSVAGVRCGASGKNVAMADWAQRFVTAVSNQANATITTNDGYPCVWFTANAGYGNYGKKNLSLDTKFKANTQYTLSFDAKKIGSATSAIINIRYTDSTVTPSPGFTATDVWEHFTVTTDAGKTVDRIQCLYSSGSAYVRTDTWQIEEGTTSTAYEPAGTSTPLTLIDDQGVAHELRSLGDYRDELHINADGSGTLYRKVVDFQYTSDYIGSAEISGGKYRFAQNVIYQAQGLRTGNAANLAKSNMLPHEDTPVSDASYSFSNSGTAQYVNVVLPSSVASSVTEFRAWLATHDLHIYFVEETPSAYHIPAINMPSLPDLVSNAWILATDADGAEIACECSIEYRRDINKVIGDIEEAIADIVAQ